MWNRYYYSFDLPKIRVGRARKQKIKLPSQTRGVFQDPYKNIFLITEICNLFIQSCNEIVL